MPFCMTELGHNFYWLFMLKSLIRSCSWLTTFIRKFLTFKTLLPQFFKNLNILFLQLDPGPCRYYPLFFHLYDDIKHLKKSSVLVARNGLGGFSDGDDGYVPAIVAAEIFFLCLRVIFVLLDPDPQGHTQGGSTGCTCIPPPPLPSLKGWL
jgi:hypothetical protein